MLFSCRFSHARFFFFWTTGGFRCMSNCSNRVYFVPLTLLLSVLFTGMPLRNRAWCARFFKFLSRNLNLNSLFLSSYLADLPYIVCCIPRSPKRNETLTWNSLQYSSHGRLKGKHVSDRKRMAKATPADVVCAIHSF